jgi:hypothetical protein
MVNRAGGAGIAQVAAAAYTYNEIAAGAWVGFCESYRYIAT